MPLESVKSIRRVPEELDDKLLKGVPGKEDKKGHPVSAEELGDVLFTYALSLPFLPSLNQKVSQGPTFSSATTQVKIAIFVFKWISEAAMQCRQSPKQRAIEKEIERQKIRAAHIAFCRLVDLLQMRHVIFLQIASQNDSEFILQGSLRAIASKA